MPVITTLPSPPSTSDPANFASKADAHILALQTFTTEVNAFGVELAGADVIATSRDTLTANATTTDLWNNSKVQDWTATPTITALPNAPQAGSWRVAYPAAGTIITHGGNISVQGNASYTVSSGDELTITAVTATTFYVTIKRKDGVAVADVAINGYFYKADTQSVAFIKTGAGTVSVKAGTEIAVASTLQTFATDTAVVMPTLTAGTDYAIYACTDGTVRADANMTNPSGYTTVNSRKIGGFHYGLVAAGTTVAGGSFATTGNGMIWTQTDVDNIAGINKFSLWDLKFRPACSNPRGMALVGNRTWVDIYLCSTDADVNGTSKSGTNIASGAVLPKIPSAFGGNGTVTYAAPKWWDFNEIARANQKRLLWEHEFVDAAFGVTENQSIDATASTYPTTQRNAGYTSKYGIEQASGHHWVWGQDSGGAAGTAYAANGGRGTSYNNSTVRALFGGARAYGANSGSRCSNWGNVPSNVSWNYGLRAACDHLQSV